MSEASFHEELISAWFDGQLIGEEKLRAEKLIADDPRCAELVQNLKKQRAHFKALPKYKLSVDLSDQVMAKFNSVNAKANNSAVVSRASSIDVNAAGGLGGGRAAVLAIASLAAMLLLTLFVFPNQFTPGLAASKVAESAEVDAPQVAATIESNELETDELEAQVEGAFDDDTASDFGMDLAKRKSTDENVVESMKSPSPLEKKEQFAELQDRNEVAKSDLVARRDKSELRMGAGGGGVGGGAGGRSAAMTAPQTLQEPRQRARAMAMPAAEVSEDLQAKVGLDIREAADQEAVELVAETREQGLALLQQAQLEPNALVASQEPVSEVWLVNEWRQQLRGSEIEKPSMSQIEQVLQKNRIAFVGSEKQSTESIQAIYVVATTEQMRSAIISLANQAQVTSFPIPAKQFAIVDQVLSEGSDDSEGEVDTAKKSVNSKTSPAFGAVAQAKQLARGIRLTPNSTPIELFDVGQGPPDENVDTIETGEMVIDDGLSGNTDKDAGQIRAPSADGQGDDKEEWYNLPENSQGLKKALPSVAGDELSPAETPVVPAAKPQKLKRFLLLIQFDE